MAPCCSTVSRGKPTCNIYIYIYMYIVIYVCVYIYIYIYIHTACAMCLICVETAPLYNISSNHILSARAEPDLLRPGVHHGRHGLPGDLSVYIHTMLVAIHKNTSVIVDVTNCKSDVKLSNQNSGHPTGGTETSPAT